MKKVKLGFVLTGALAIALTMSSYGFSIRKSTKNSVRYEALRHLSASEFVTLPAKQFGELIGKKLNMRDKLFFMVLKLRIKHDLIKNPHFQIKDYYFLKKKSSILLTLLWVFLGFLALILLLVLIFGKLD